VLLHYVLSDFFGLLWAEVRPGIVSLRFKLIKLLLFVVLLHLHLDELLVFEVLQPFQLLLDLEGLLLRGDLVLELLLLDLFLSAELLKLFLNALLSIGFSQLVVLMELFTLYFVVVVDCVGSL
jgi:hypothetical protein